MALGKALQITQALAMAQDPQHGDQQQIPGGDGDAHSTTHKGIRDRLQKTDQFEVGDG